MIDNPIEQFILDTETVVPEQTAIMEAVRAIYRKRESNITEKLIYGGIGFFLNDKHIGGVYGHKAHVNIVFSLGHLLSDPDKLLEGKGKYRRHLKASGKDDVVSKQVAFFVEQVLMLEKSDC